MENRRAAHPLSRLLPSLSASEKASPSATRGAANSRAPPCHRAASPHAPILEETLILRGFLIARAWLRCTAPRERRAMMHRHLMHRQTSGARDISASSARRAAPRHREKFSRKSARIAFAARVIAGIAHGAMKRRHARRAEDARRDFSRGILSRASIDIARAIAAKRIAARIVAHEEDDGSPARIFATRGEILKICRQRRPHGRSERFGREFFNGCCKPSAAPRCRDPNAVLDRAIGKIVRCANRSRVQQSKTGCRDRRQPVLR
jgi:hypothetical protein